MINIPAVILQAALSTSNPELLLAISYVESTWRVNARGKAGEVGALQLHPKYHTVPATVKGQFKYADKYIRYLKGRCGEQLFLACYNLGPRKVTLDNKHGQRYTKLVLEALRGIKQDANNRRAVTQDQSEVRVSAND